jgi:hypothetical protein
MRWQTWFNRPARRALAWGLAAAVAVPWLIGQWVKTGLQPGIADAADKAAALVDFAVLGGIVFTLSMWIVAAYAYWIVGVMKGPRYLGDAFPPDEPRGTP